MTMNYDHLAPPVRPYMEQSDAERINLIRLDKWVGYERAREILAKMTDLKDHPTVTRPPCMLLVGDSNSGKSRILNRFKAQHPTIDNYQASNVRIPVVRVDAPTVPSEARLYEVLLDELFAPYKSGSSVQAKQDQVCEILTQIGCEVLLIDEMNYLLAGGVSKQKEVLNGIKTIANRTGRPIVAAGVRDSLRLMQMDEQIANRFEPVMLRRWTLDDDFLRLLSSLEVLTPLKYPSELAADDMAAKLMAMSEGLLGEVCTVIKTAAIAAIRSGEERISNKTLASLQWTPPSRRKRQAEAL